METLHTIFHFIVAIGVLVSIHEFGHFWVARMMGVKVLRFSVGFGKVIWSYQKTSDSTEYVLSAIPLGGYVKMVDEREGEVKAEDLPYAFNRQPLLPRFAIVAAGPIFNLLLSVILFSAIFIMGETGMKPIVGEIEPSTLAAEAGFIEGEEILSINNEETPTWLMSLDTLFSFAMQGKQEIIVKVKNIDENEKVHLLRISEKDIQEPKLFYKRLGLKPWSPTLKPIIGEVLEDGRAKTSGLEKGDLIITANNVPITDWMQWVDYIKNRPEIPIQLLIERDDVRLSLTLTPEKIESEEKDFGRIGASVYVPEDLMNSFRVVYSLPPTEAVIKAVEKTGYYSVLTLQMMGKMLIGASSTKNLSGPISIAQYAGKSAELGLIPFLKFLAMVSISLGVLNLLPIPVLDGGHLMFFIIEAVKGSPVSEKIQIYFQQVGIMMLMTLMAFAVFLDMERLLQ